MQTSSQASARGWPARLAMCAAASLLAFAARANEPADAAGGSILSDLHIEPDMILAQAIGFLVMFYILWRMVFRRVGGILDRRRTDIVDRLSKIEQDQIEAERLRRDTEQRLADIGREAQARYDTAASEGEQQRERIVAEAREAAQAEVERAQEAIGREKAAAVLELRAEVAGLVVQATRQILGEALDEDRQRQIVDDMIRRLPTQ